MKNLLNYIILPKERSAGELKHVSNINRIALLVAYLHIPAFMLVAYLCGTGVSNALILSALVLFGPTVAYKTLDDPRALSMVFGFTSMCLGAVLVHLGQSSVQIEMHFHFFVFLALLAVYGNPLTVLVAAVTVALHHSLFWFFFPSSVFNYDAQLWVVGVHALFVVLESIASCFIARSFFDNVIGLEKILDQRTAQLNSMNRDMKLILDNTFQGFITVDLQGNVSAERSKIVDEIFGRKSDELFWEWFEGEEEGIGKDIKMGFENLLDQFNPELLTLQQLPKIMKKDGHVYTLEYQPIRERGNIKVILVIITNITAEIAQKESEKNKQELLRVFECINRDRYGFVEFLEDAEKLITRLLNQSATLEEVKRDIHTLKGNAGAFGISSLFDLCYEIENHLDTKQAFVPRDREQLEATWKGLMSSFSKYLGEDHEEFVQVTAAELSDLIKEADHFSTKEIKSRLHQWYYEPVRFKMRRYSQQAERIAKRLGIKGFTVSFKDHSIRTPQALWNGFWGAFVHVIRNALDHGLSDFVPADGGTPCLQLETKVVDKRFQISVHDNGKGIDWVLVAEKAAKLGLANESKEDLKEALFADGFTTREVLSDLSGRGVGLSAIRNECLALGGKIEVHSEKNMGTTIVFEFPLNSLYEEKIELLAS